MKQLIGPKRNKKQDIFIKYIDKILIGLDLFKLSHQIINRREKIEIEFLNSSSMLHTNTINKVIKYRDTDFAKGHQYRTCVLLVVWMND